MGEMRNVISKFKTRCLRARQNMHVKHGGTPGDPISIDFTPCSVDNGVGLVHRKRAHRKRREEDGTSTAAHGSDEFCRWRAATRLVTRGMNTDAQNRYGGAGIAESTPGGHFKASSLRRRPQVPHRALWISATFDMDAAGVRLCCRAGGYRGRHTPCVQSGSGSSVRLKSKAGPHAR